MNAGDAKVNKIEELNDRIVPYTQEVLARIGHLSDELRKKLDPQGAKILQEIEDAYIEYAGIVQEKTITPPC